MAEPRARLLSLASGVLPEFSPAVTAAAAADAGWDAVGLWVEPRDWTAATTRAVRRIVAEAGLSVLDVEVVWIKPGPLDPDHLRILDVAAEVGAANVLAVSSDPDPGATAAKLAALAAHARACGTRIALEFAAFTAVKTLEAACALLAQDGCAEVSLLIDPLHFTRSGGRIAALGAVAAERLRYAQFCDAAAAGPAMTDTDAILHEAIDLRLLPGEGGLDLRGLLAALPAALDLSVELRSRALREAWPEAGARAAALLRATKAWFAGAP